VEDETLAAPNQN